MPSLPCVGGPLDGREIPFPREPVDGDILTAQRERETKPGEPPAVLYRATELEQSGWRLVFLGYSPVLGPHFEMRLRCRVCSWETTRAVPVGEQQYACESCGNPKCDMERVT